MKYQVLSQKKRGSQYEILYSVMDDLDQLIVGNLIKSVGVKELDKQGLDILFQDVIYPQVNEMLIAEDSKEIFTREEIETILKEKGYLLENEKWEDLQSKAK